LFLNQILYSCWGTNEFLVTFCGRPLWKYSVVRILQKVCFLLLKPCHSSFTCCRYSLNYIFCLWFKILDFKQIVLVLFAGAKGDSYPEISMFEWFVVTAATSLNITSTWQEAGTPNSSTKWITNTLWKEATSTTIRRISNDSNHHFSRYANLNLLKIWRQLNYIRLKLNNMIAQ